jgi:hypothetical protein
MFNEFFWSGSFLIEVKSHHLIYPASTAKLDGISVLTVPFFPPPNRALLLRIMSLFGGGKKGCVKTEIPSNFAVEAGYINSSLKIYGDKQR